MLWHIQPRDSISTVYSERLEVLEKEGTRLTIYCRKWKGQEIFWMRTAIHYYLEKGNEAGARSATRMSLMSAIVSYTYGYRGLSTFMRDFAAFVGILVTINPIGLRNLSD